MISAEPCVESQEKMKSARMKSYWKHREKIAEGKKRRYVEDAVYRLKLQERSRKYYQNNKERHKKTVLAYQKKHHGELKREVLSVYSGGIAKCACCGERHLEFLTIDHMNGDGKQSRVVHGGGAKFYRYLKKNNFPRDLGLQVLCMNCNFSLGHAGYCPHKEEMDD